MEKYLFRLGLKVNPSKAKVTRDNGVITVVPSDSTRKVWSFENERHAYKYLVALDALDPVYGYTYHDGEQYTLLQDPYIDGMPDERPYFRALVIDSDEQMRHAIWDIIEGREDLEDESDMCDWDNATVIE